MVQNCSELLFGSQFSSPRFPCNPESIFSRMTNGGASTQHADQIAGSVSSKAPSLITATCQSLELSICMGLSTSLMDCLFNISGLEQASSPAPASPRAPMSSSDEHAISDSPISFIIFKPSDDDILCDRGKKSFNHEGNRKFRICIASHLQAYSNAPDRPSRAKIIGLVVSQLLQNGSRFLKRQCKKGQWYQLGIRDAQGKVAHALRDACTNSNKSIYKLYQRQHGLVLIPPPDNFESKDYEPTPFEFESPSLESHRVDEWKYASSPSPSVGSDSSCDFEIFDDISLVDFERSIEDLCNVSGFPAPGG
jgi:hypothetical protein